MKLSRDLLYTTTFNDELHSPREFTTPDGIDYRAYMFNREFDGKEPVVTYFGFGSTPDNQPGMEYISAYAAHLDRPFTVLQPSTVPRGFTRHDMAASNAAAIDHPAVHKNEQVSLTGLSFGAVVSYNTAGVLQDQANHVVTVSSVGTRNGLREYILPSIEVFLQEKGDMTDSFEARLHDLNPFTEHSSLLGRLALRQRMARIFAEPSFTEIPTMLHKDTKWTDYIGEHDEYSDATIHQRTVLERNRIHPDSSTSIVLPEMRHMWSTKKHTLAKLVRHTLHLHELETERNIAKITTL